MIRLAGGSPEHPEIDLEGVDLSTFEMSFGATVTVVLDDGRRLECAQAVPLGAAGRARSETEKVVEAKFARETSALLGEEPALRVAQIVGGLETATPDEVQALADGLRGAR